MSSKKALGQFFTPKSVADFMVSLLSDDLKKGWILEPSCGEGVFLTSLIEAGFNKVIGVEIDDVASMHKDKILNVSFISYEPNVTVSAVIGNPPYVRWKNLSASAKKELANDLDWQKYFNGLCDYYYIFILKSIKLLKPDGELIFIAPSFWFSTTHAATLRDFALDNGSFLEIYNLHETPIFDKVSMPVAIFKYKKGAKIDVIKMFDYKSNTLDFNQPSEVSTVPQFKAGSRFVLSNEVNVYPKTKLGEIAEISNGMVTGLDKAFQIPEGLHLSKEEIKASINVVKAKCILPYVCSCKTPYIFAEDKLAEHVEIKFKQRYPNFYALLLPYKEQLLKRYSYGKSTPFWQWSFLRNYAKFSTPQPRIFVPGKDRITNKKSLRFAYGDSSCYPTQDVSCILLHPDLKESIYYILAWLNSSMIFDWAKRYGIVKGGVIEFSRSPLSEVPIRLIDWNSDLEKGIHKKITNIVQNIVAYNGDLDNSEKDLQKLFSELNSRTKFD